MAVPSLLPRQNDGYYYGGYWYSSTAYIIKWIVVAVIFALCIGFCVGGYIHAKRRMKKGLPPKAYHRWLIRRRDRVAFHMAHPEHPNPYAPRQNYFIPGVGQSPYPMQPMYGPPPPAYGTPEYVPAYAPPQGASKANPDQNWQSPPAGASNAQPGQSQPPPPPPQHPGGDLGART